jgi:succinyl-CoA synthetase alpha subunit
VSILIDEATSVLVQGITGYQGQFHAKQMLAYGTQILAGVTPGKGGQRVEGIPVFDTVRAAMEAYPIDVSVLFTPAAFTMDAAIEALEAGVKTLVIITEHVPLHDAMELMAYAKRVGATIVGPNTFGLVSPGKCKIGIAPNAIFSPGEVGVVARSGTLSYEIVGSLTNNGIGQSTVVGIGGDRVIGQSFVDVLRRFEKDPATSAVVLVGEIGGSDEEDAALYIREMTKPVVAYIAGKSAPPGKRMGHAGAIIEKGKGTYSNKTAALREAGVKVVTLPFEVATTVKAELSMLHLDPFYGLTWSMKQVDSIE